MAVVAYRRVSTAEARLDRQDLGPDVDETFEEKVSGKDRQRPELARAIAYCRRGDTFRVHSVDRLGRSLSDLLAIVRELTDKGVRVEFVKERRAYDPNSHDPQDKLMLAVLAAFAEYERDILLGRQAEGIALAKQRGVYKGRQPSLTPQEVRTARERRGLGVPVARLARDHGVAKSTMVDALAGAGVYGCGEYAA